MRQTRGPCNIPAIVTLTPSPHTPCPTCQTQNELGQALDDFSRFVLHPTWVIVGIASLLCIATAIFLADWKATTAVPCELAIAVLSLVIVTRTYPWCTRRYLAAAMRQENLYLELLDQYDRAMCQPCTCPRVPTFSQPKIHSTALVCIPSELQKLPSQPRSHPYLKAL